MPPGRKPTHSPEDFVEAAIAFADVHGIASMTLRDLGRAMGVSATAVYRYFDDKESLVVAMREALLAHTFTDEPADSPDDAIVQIALAYRAAARAHPCLSQIIAVRVDRGDTSLAVPTVIGNHLRAMGLRGEDAALGYRQLESFVVGVTLIDFSGAPLHLEDRLERMHHGGQSDVATGQNCADDVDRLNEAAFEATLRMLVANLAARGALTKETWRDAGGGEESG